MSVKVEKICEPVLLGEGPHWDAAQQCLFYVSILENTIHKYTPSTNKHSKTKLSDQVGFILPVEGAKDQFVVGLGCKFVVIQWDGEDGSPAKVIKELAEVDTDIEDTRINDGKCDPRGRIFAGTMGKESNEGEKGSLYRLEGNKCAKVSSKIGISNGLAWNMEDHSFYYIDSLEKAVTRYDYDVKTGEISNKRHIFDLAKHGIEGFPDGMTIDTEGYLYVAVFSGSCVIKIDPKKDELLQKIPIPVEQVTSVTFGGPKLDVLYVTTASMTIGSTQHPPAGALFKVTGLGAKGHPNLAVKL